MSFSRHEFDCPLVDYDRNADIIRILFKEWPFFEKIVTFGIQIPHRSSAAYDSSGKPFSFVFVKVSEGIDIHGAPRYEEIRKILHGFILKHKLDFPIIT